VAVTEPAALSRFQLLGEGGGVTRG
jgi:hypothetical protein